MWERYCSGGDGVGDVVVAVMVWERCCSGGDVTFFLVWKDSKKNN